jgi:hypothetical protein
MRSVLLVVGAACSSSEPADADTDLVADTEVEDTDTDLVVTGVTADTGTAPDRAGTYVGTMTVIAADVVAGEEAYALCSDPAFTLTVDDLGGVTGGGGCTMPAPLEGKGFSVTLTGALGIPPELAGAVTISWPSVPKPLPEVWVADFEGPETIDGHFEGTWSEGEQRFDYGAEFLLVR